MSKHRRPVFRLEIYPYVSGLIDVFFYESTKPPFDELTEPLPDESAEPLFDEFYRCDRKITFDSFRKLLSLINPPIVCVYLDYYYNPPGFWNYFILKLRRFVSPDPAGNIFDDYNGKTFSHFIWSLILNFRKTAVEYVI